MSIYPLLIERIVRDYPRIKNGKRKRGCVVCAFPFSAGPVSYKLFGLPRNIQDSANELIAQPSY